MALLFTLPVLFAIVEQFRAENERRKQAEAERIQRRLDDEHLLRFGWTKETVQKSNNN